MSLKNSLKQTSLELMSIPSVSSDLRQLKKVISLAKKFFQKSSLIIKEHQHNGKPSLVITTQKTKSPQVFLVGHLDVVPGSKKILQPQVKGNRLIGRGAADMKVQCAVMMHLLKELSTHPSCPSVGLMLTTDEEVGGEDGVKYLLNEQGYRSKVAFIPDGLGTFQMSLSQKGIFIIKIIQPGQSAHASTPWNGSSSVETFIQEYTRFKSKFFGRLKAPDYWQNTCSLTIVKSGEVINKVPDHLEAVLDIRFINEKFFQKLQKALPKFFPHATFTTLVKGSAVELMDHKLLKRFLKLAHQHLGKKQVGLIKEHGASDARHFASHNIPSIIINPDCGGLHSDHEWANLSTIESYYNLLRQFVLEEMEQ